MTKFKVGDKVRLVGKKENSSEFHYDYVPRNVKLPAMDLVVDNSKVHPMFSRRTGTILCVEDASWGLYYKVIFHSVIFDGISLDSVSISVFPENLIEVVEDEKKDRFDMVLEDVR